MHGERLNSAARSILSARKDTTGALPLILKPSRAVRDIMDPNATEISIHDGNVKCITFKPNGCCLLVAGSSGYIRQWKVDSGEEVCSSTRRMKTDGTIYAIAASKDGRWIVTGDSEYKVIVWDAVTHTIATKISEHTGLVFAVDVSSDSTWIASGSKDRTVQIFDIFSGVRVIPPLEHAGAVDSIKISPDDGRIATITQHRLVGVYDVHSGNQLFDIQVQPSSRLRTVLAWSSDGQQLFVASSPGKITRLDTSTSFSSERLIHSNKNNGRIVTHGRFIACASGSSVSFWESDHTSHKQIGNLIDHANTVNSMSISHDGRYLACGHDKDFTIHNLGDFLPGQYLRAPLVSPFPLMQVSDAVLESWILGNPTDAETLLSEEITQSSDSSHHALAARSLIRTRLREWKTAIEDAETSLQIQSSPIGHIARCLALVASGKQEAALDDLDFAFCDCDPSDIVLLLVIKSIFMFMCGKHTQAVSRLQYIITAAHEKTKGHYVQVLGNMYLKQGDYENVIQTLKLAKDPFTSAESNLLMTISLIFNWNFDHLEVTAWQRLCDSLHSSGDIKGVGETLSKMVGPLTEDEKEYAHGRILEEIVMRTGQVTLLAWTGKSSRCNSCLPSSPTVYTEQPFVPPRLEPAELERRTDELRAVFPLVDALMIYDRVTRLQPVRFVHFRLHLPCIVLGVRRLRKQDNVYHAETTGLGDVEFTTADVLPLKEPRRLVFADLRIHGLLDVKPVGSATSEDTLEWDVGSNSSDMGDSIADTEAELVHAPIIEEARSVPQLDEYTRALQLIAHLGQPFSPLLLLRQSDGVYRRVAADHEIVVRGTGKNVPKDIRVEVLEIV